MQKRIEKLKQQVRELTEWKRQNSIQQIPFNPPVNVTNIIQKNYLIVQDNFVITGSNNFALEIINDTEILYLSVVNGAAIPI